MAHSWAKAWRATRICLYRIQLQGGKLLGLPLNIASVKQLLIFACKVSMQEAKLAKEKMHGKLACGRPLVVRLASEKFMTNTTNDTSKAAGESSKSRLGGSNYGQLTRSDKIAAIKNKLRALEGGGESSSVKKQKQDNISCQR